MVYLNNIVVILIFFTLFFASKLIVGEVINDDGATEKEKQELGRHLFFDVRLSEDGNRSCALCHDVNHGWANKFTRTLNIDNTFGRLNTPSILNVINYKHFSQENSNINSIYKSVLNPLFNKDEMSMNEGLLIKRLSEASSIYSELFFTAYGDREITLTRVVESLVYYISLINSKETRYHQYKSEGHNIMTKKELNGMNLFYSYKLKCAQCHGGDLFNTPDESNVSPYFNTGLYGILDDAGDITYPDRSAGARLYTQKKNDDGKFRVPSLINVTNTGPWGHDGSFRTLSSMIESYANGGRLIATGRDAGDGRLHPSKDQKITGFLLSNSEKEELISFLTALSVQEVNSLEMFQSPFCSTQVTSPKGAVTDCIPPFKK
ncbi:cytochrome c peroxidase [Shewanella baltica]|uniref:cytochrome-c peroxidase n=1 Tax=Shewanella baltica TaxID=62322 RepID=UPI002870DBD6|nr:cytochrome c peroxidase [Shewanella baltica]MDR9767512.1 cytochrome c peroxidase [Shewanella baltica]